MKKSNLILCSVIEHDIDGVIRLKLEKEMLSLYKRHFGEGVSINVIWIEVPNGQAYQAGKLSKTATILCSVENQLPQHQRVPFIEDVCELWHQHTAKPKNRLVVSAADEERVKYVISLSRDRVGGVRKVIVLLKMISQLLVSKLKRGYLSMNINLNA